MSKISKFFSSSKRILSISQKPTRKEFLLMSKIVGFGIILIGLIGYVLKLIFSYI